MSSSETLVKVFDPQTGTWMNDAGTSANRLLGVPDDRANGYGQFVSDPSRAQLIPADKVEELKEHWPFLKRCEFLSPEIADGAPDRWRATEVECYGQRGESR